MEKAKKIAQQLQCIYNISGSVNIELDWNEFDEYVYRLTFFMYIMGAKLRAQVELKSTDVDFDMTLQKLVREAIAQVQSQITFLLV